MKPEERAFACGAAILGGVSHRQIGKHMKRHHDSISTLVKRVQERAEESGLQLWDPHLYETEIGRGRKELLTQDQKDKIIRIVTQDRHHREQESWQAIANGDFDEILGLPKMSVELFENVMYEAGYSRGKQGYKPELVEKEKKERHEWAKAHNPDKYDKGDNLGFNFRRAVYTDETPARVGEQRGVHRAWIKKEEKYLPDVKKPRIQKYSQLQFYGAFTYGEKGPCHIYEKETKEEKQKAFTALQKENKARKEQATNLHRVARAALGELGEAVNSRRSAYRKSDDLKRGDRSRGGVDGYRHREEVLKPLLVPWIKSLKRRGKTDVLLLEDRAPAHSSKFDEEFLAVKYISKLPWPGHSPDVNAEEHAWPWIRRHITKDFEPSRSKDECKAQWYYEWRELPQDQINTWIDRIPDVVRHILEQEGDNSFHDG